MSRVATWTVVPSGPVTAQLADGTTVAPANAKIEDSIRRSDRLFGPVAVAAGTHVVVKGEASTLDELRGLHLHLRNSSSGATSWADFVAASNTFKAAAIHLAETADLTPEAVEYLHSHEVTKAFGGPWGDLSVRQALHLRRTA
jgi:hypothetical protein